MRFLTLLVVLGACDGAVSTPTPDCTTQKSVTNWVVASVVEGNPITMTISLIFNVTGTELANTFTITGATQTAAPHFDAGSLAGSKNVTLELQPDAGATNIEVQTGITCGTDARAIAFSFALADLTSTGSASPPVKQLSP